jgi:hypothetical protein
MKNKLAIYSPQNVEYNSASGTNEVRQVFGCFVTYRQSWVAQTNMYADCYNERHDNVEAQSP